MLKTTILAIFAVIIVIGIVGLLNFHPELAYSSPFEVDVTANVYKVIDGDTFDSFPVGRVRLADVNAPERGEVGYYEAKDALTGMVLNKKVYLDVDDYYVIDRYNRLICLVYIRYNSTHLLNVNKWLILNGYVITDDYDNEFNPNLWMLFIYYPEELEATTITVMRTTTTTIPTPTTITTTTTKTLIETTTIIQPITEIREATLTKIVKVPSPSYVVAGFIVGIIIVGIIVGVFIIRRVKKSFRK